jgi:anti-sigma factor RsiW
MEGCDAFELAIEMRLHGALPPEQGPALDAHLVTCERCQRFLYRAEETQRAMATTGSAVAEAVPPGRTWEQLQRMIRSERTWLWRRAALVAALVPLIGFLSGSFLLAAGVVGMVGGALLTVLVLENRRASREAALVGNSRGDMLALYRQLLERRIARASRMRRVLPMLGVVELTLTSARVPWPKSLDKQSMAWFAVGVFAVCIGRALYLSFRVLPSLRRELGASQS